MVKCVFHTFQRNYLALLATVRVLCLHSQQHRKEIQFSYGKFHILENVYQLDAGAISRLESINRK